MTDATSAIYIITLRPTVPLPAALHQCVCRAPVLRFLEDALGLLAVFLAGGLRRTDAFFQVRAYGHDVTADEFPGIREFAVLLDDGG